MDMFGICPVTTAQKVLSGKWTLLVIYLLSQKTMRFNELQKQLGSLTPATLAKQLRTMEENRLIVRTAYNQIPPKVEYTLSEFGKQLAPVLEELGIWGARYIEFLKAEPKE
ncbi:MAG: winged helix-turn-helix transcriptional regulator [Oscillospiraceae bacterium]